MGAGITIWVRRGESESQDAQSFLRTHGYAADAVRDADTQPPTGAERDRLVAGLGGDAGLLDDRKAPGRLRAPLLLTPKGALAGFRESRWRAFLDIGRGRN